jgi:Ribonuclease G/E
MTKLNLMELTRKKDKENFFNLMTVHCEHCSGSGRVPSIIQIKMKIENIVSKVKKNTSSEAVVLRTGSMLYEKISKCGSQFLDMIQEKYGIKIYIKEDRSIVTKEIMVEKMGKIEYINSEK